MLGTPRTTSTHQHYRYERILKSSSSSTTILVRNPSTNKLSVLKRGGPSLFQEARLLQKFSSTNSPHIVRFEEAFEDELGRECVVMEWCEGGDLAAWIEQTGREERERQAVTIMRQLAAGLQTIHAANVIHRDLKPKNIFISRPPSHLLLLKIGDFGVSREASTADTALGTPLYLCPEIVRGLPYSSASDIWSLGCVLYEVVSGEPPFATKSFKELLHSICRVEPLDLKHPLNNIIMACLRKDPKERPTAAEIEKELSGEAGRLMSRLDAIKLLQSKFGDTLSFNIIHSLTEDLNVREQLKPSKYKEALSHVVPIPTNQTALIHKVVRLRCELGPLFGYDDEKLEHAARQMSIGASESQFTECVGQKVMVRLNESEGAFFRLKELSLLEAAL
jgi:serine/threonine protein kinase